MHSQFCDILTRKNESTLDFDQKTLNFTLDFSQK